MRTWLALGMAIVTTGVAIAQDKTEVEVSDEAKTAVGKALDTALGAGGLKFSGNVKNDMGENQIFKMMGAAKMDQAFTGKFTAVCADGALLVTVEEKNGSIEIFKQGTKVIKRQTWTKDRTDVDDFAAEIGTLIDLAHLKEHLAKAKFKKPTEEKSDDKTFTIIRGSLPLRILGEEEEEVDPQNLQDLSKLHKMWKMTTQELNAEFRIAADGTLSRITFELGKHSKLMDMVKIQMGQKGGDDEDENKPHATVKYVLEVTASGAEVKAEIPKEIRKYLEK